MGWRGEAKSMNHRETTVTAPELDSTPHRTHRPDAEANRWHRLVLTPGYNS